MVKFITVLSSLLLWGLYVKHSSTCDSKPSYNVILDKILQEGPGDTSYHNGMEYGYFNKTNVTYATAVDLCAEWNGTLATIKDNATQMHIEDSMPRASCRHFYTIGLSHANEENHTLPDNYTCLHWLYPNSSNEDYPRWVWSDGTPLNETGFTNWKSDSNKGFIGQEPNGCKKTNKSSTHHSPYVQISSNLSNNYGKWYDKHVKSSWFVICQRKAPMPTTTSPAITPPETTTAEMTTLASTTTTLPVTSSPTTSPVPTSEVTTRSHQPITTENASTTTPTQSASTATTIQYETTATTAKNVSGVIDNILRNFSVQDWENNGARLLAEAVLSQPNSNASSYDYPDRGVYIRVEKVNTSSADVKNIQLEVSPDPGNTATVDSNDFSSISDDVVLVSASFSRKAYKKSGLSSVLPLTDENDKQAAGRMHSEISILPKDVKVISMSLFKSVNKTSSAEKVSIPVSTTFNLTGERVLSNMYLQQKRKVLSSTPKCVYYDTSDAHKPTWSGKGCKLVRNEPGLAKCFCNHTTSFGVIFAVTSIKIPSEIDLLLIALEIISVLALTLTVSLLLWLRKRLHRDRTWIQINLSGSLLLLHFFFLMGTVAVNERNPQLCEAFAVLSHYFTISTALWMFNEGLVLHLKTGERALKFSVTRVLPRLLCLAWGFPFLYVLLCATIGLLRGVYMDVRLGYHEGGLLPKYDRCWLGFKYHMIYSAIVPLVIIFAATTVLLVKISLAINKMSKEALKLRPSVMTLSGERGMTPASSVASIPIQKERILIQARVTFKAAVTLLPVLGVPWLLAFLVNIPGAEVPFLIIHGIVNGLQGIFVFIVYCARSKQFRMVLKRKWKQMPSSTQSFSLNRFSSGYPS